MLKNRPTSPHLQVYSLQINSFLSIMHRVTGFFLSFLFFFFILFKLKDYNILLFPYYSKFTLTSYFVSIGYSFLLCFLTIMFYYHLFNGLRHIFWDTGLGFTVPNILSSSLLILLVSFLFSTIEIVLTFS
uniref:Succinate dehydrogenase subunit 3 n=1 Tax=Gloeochaete wittrockiana TaxID=38269 RepID=A0A096Y6S1_9EUKA|nr:succinate dehydrogenase subunit 3 [Gloeochaete wittrockiana]AIM52035.1 succinate dehydrogenase subunit 3 [Gloeochaete wittrockiana]